MVEKRSSKPVVSDFRPIASTLYVDSNRRYVVRNIDKEKFNPIGFSELRRLKDAYGVSMPKFSLSNRKFVSNVASEGKTYELKGEKFCVAEHVDGVKVGYAFKDIVTAEELSDFSENANVICDGLASYFLDAYYQRASGFYLNDLHPEQFMYGATTNNPKKRIMLVDLDPFVSKITEEQIHIFIERGPGYVAELVVALEKQIGTDLKDARKKLTQFFPLLKNWMKDPRNYSKRLYQVLTKT